MTKTIYLFMFLYRLQIIAQQDSLNTVTKTINGVFLRLEPREDTILGAWVKKEKS